ncbi:hypothetical protein ILYODFUR_036268 [Ilyodon furcidens]|uniref:Uncharacterized protein n=1 Tax=Ilyodon furcidens TaxID=33524 RepID=A0ABV0UFG1_9TELE
MGKWTLKVSFSLFLRLSLNCFSSCPKSLVWHLMKSSLFLKALREFPVDLSEKESHDFHSLIHCSVTSSPELKYEEEKRAIKNTKLFKVHLCHKKPDACGNLCIGLFAEMCSDMSMDCQLKLVGFLKPA